MDLLKKLNEIDEHFKNVTSEELEKNLKKAGLGIIKNSSTEDEKENYKTT